MMLAIRGIIDWNFPKKPKKCVKLLMGFICSWYGKIQSRNKLRSIWALLYSVVSI